MNPLTNLDIRWLTSAQVEMKLRLGLKGEVYSLYERKKSVDLSSTATSYTSTQAECYIPESRKLTLTSVQATNLLKVLQVKVPKGEAYQLVPETKHYGSNVSVHAWGIIHQDRLYIFRFCNKESSIFQIWGILEASTYAQGYELIVDNNPVINYVLSLPYSL